jgi:hypothetical protein
MMATCEIQIFPYVSLREVISYIDGRVEENF